MPWRSHAFTLWLLLAHWSCRTLRLRRTSATIYLPLLILRSLLFLFYAARITLYALITPRLYWFRLTNL